MAISSLPSRGLLITNGIGDFLACESFMSEADRAAVETAYYAAGEGVKIRQLLEAFAPRFPNLKRHVTLWSQFGPELPCFLSANHVKQYVPVPAGVRDFSIARVFPEVAEGLHKLNGSTALCQPLTGSDYWRTVFGGAPYVAIFPATVDNTPPTRNFSSEDWHWTREYLKRTGKRGVVLGMRFDHAAEPHAGMPFIDLRGRTTLLESIELLKSADSYIGVDSCLAVLAAQLFDWPNLAIKCVRPQGVAWASVYWAARARFLQDERSLPWLGSTIASVLARLPEEARVT